MELNPNYEPGMSRKDGLPVKISRIELKRARCGLMLAGSDTGMGLLARVNPDYGISFVAAEAVYSGHLALLPHSTNYKPTDMNDREQIERTIDEARQILTEQAARESGRESAFTN